MNIQPVKAYINENEWVKVAGFMLAGVLVLLVVHFSVVRPQMRRLAQYRADLEQLRAKAQRYHTFVEFQARLGEVNGQVSSLSSGYTDSMFSGKQTEQDFLDRIASFCQQANVRLDRINQTKIDSGQAWDVSLTAPFPSINTFMNTLEKYFRIEGLRLRKGEDGRGHQAEMIIAPIIVAGSGGLSAGADIFELFDRTDEIAKKISVRQSETEINGQVLLDPFTGGDLFKKPEPPKPEPQKIEPVVETPRVPIEGIYWDPETPVVVIAGKALREGDTIKDAKIVKIREDSVTFEWHGRTHTLKAGKKGE